jgi:hypothetical protein
LLNVKELTLETSSFVENGDVTGVVSTLLVIEFVMFSCLFTHPPLHYEYYKTHQLKKLIFIN